MRFKGKHRGFLDGRPKESKQRLEVNAPLPQGEMFILFTRVVMQMQLPKIGPENLNPSISSLATRWYSFTGY